MRKDEAQDIMDRLASFEKIEHKATDEAGWIALAYSCSRGQAEKKIEKAKAIMAKAQR